MIVSTIRGSIIEEQKNEHEGRELIPKKEDKKGSKGKKFEAGEKPPCKKNLQLRSMEH